MDFILFSNFCYTDENRKLKTYEKSYAICVDGISQGIFKKIPDEFKHLEVKDYSESVVFPGFVDLHVHAPQYEFRATDMDCELIEWLNKYTFKTESQFKDINYADYMYNFFVSDLKNSEITRAVIFATLHKDATLKLMEKLDKTGLNTFVGKVNMDRNSPDYYVETTENSIKDTKKWISECNFKNTLPIITPRFTPTCTDELMVELGKIAKQNSLNIQSHLSENKGEIEWVKELCKDAKNYADTYDRADLLGSQSKSIMAHCVLCPEDEVKLMKERGTFVAHCPSSNVNLTSGIAPIAKYLQEGLNVGFGSDVAGGHRLSIFNEMILAIQLSKMYTIYVDSSVKPLTFVDALHMATLGGGKFFGKVGSFDEGYEFDAIVIDDSAIKTSREFDLTARTERIIYLNIECKILEKYTNGRKIF